MCATSDHPREYGENAAGANWLWGAVGSSPRIRGECVEEHRNFAGKRIIPANTGRINRRRRIALAVEDHPREYGENHTARYARPFAQGSSPRIRGESHTKPATTKQIGIIPANTGRI